MGLYLATKCLDHLTKAGKDCKWWVNLYPQTQILTYFWPTLLWKDSWTRDDRWGSLGIQWSILVRQCSKTLMPLHVQMFTKEGLQAYVAASYLLVFIVLWIQGIIGISPLSSPVRDRCVLTFLPDSINNYEELGLSPIPQEFLQANSTNITKLYPWYVRRLPIPTERNIKNQTVSFIIKHLFYWKQQTNKLKIIFLWNMRQKHRSVFKSLRPGKS